LGSFGLAGVAEGADALDAAVAGGPEVGAAEAVLAGDEPVVAADEPVDEPVDERVDEVLDEPPPQPATATATSNGRKRRRIGTIPTGGCTGAWTG
jgi:hypothetical protein